MRSASPAFQPDRGPGAPGFQLAEDHGFQTQGAVCLGNLHVRVGVASPSFFSSPHRTYVGDVVLVAAIESPTHGPRDAGGRGTRRGVRLLGQRWAVEGDVGLVVAVESPSRFLDEFERDEEDVLVLISAMLATRVGRHPDRELDQVLLALVDLDDAALAR